MRSILLTALLLAAIYDRDNNQRVNAHVGETIEIRLLVPADGQGGWSITHIDYSVLKPGRPQVVPKRRSDPPETAVQVFRIRVLDQRSTTLRLRYYGHSSKRYKPVNRTFTIHIN